MKAASISEIKQELLNTPPKKVVELCLRLARFKKENKELLTFLLFDAHNEAGYVQSIKEEINEHFLQLNTNSMYFIKKGLRKVVRQISKYCKYINEKSSEVEMRIYFCSRLNASGIPYTKNLSLLKIYQQQLKKLYALVDELHEDLKFDYTKQLQAL